MEHGLLAWTMVAIVGTVGVIKNFITFGGKRFWTLMTILVGVGVAIAAMYLPIKAMQIWVAVTGATLFYDTIYKSFEKLIKYLVANFNKE